MSEQVLVIAAHPDDEILGCGGTMAKHVAAGDRVSCVIMAEGMTSRAAQRDRDAFKDELQLLGQAAQKAADIIGVHSLDLLDFPDNRMDSVDRITITKAVEALIEKEKPSIIYTHHAGDVNIDHRCIHEAVVTATRPMPGYKVKKILTFEVASSTEWQMAGSAPAFTPNWYEDISNYLEKKIQALEVYTTEMREWPHARSCKALEYLSRWRGSNIGVEAAEAFMLGRYIGE